MVDHGDSPAGRPSLNPPTGSVSRPVGRFGLSLEPAHRLSGANPKGPLLRGLTLVAASGGAAALYIWDDLLLATPVVAAASIWGPFLAWAVFSVVYGAASVGLALAVVAAYDRVGSGKAGRTARWLQRQLESRRGRWARRLISGGQIVGFALASFLLGGIVTTWMVRVTHPDRPVIPTAVVSCAIFGVTFSAQYAGIAALVL